MKGLTKVLDQEKTVTAEERREIASLLDKANGLLKGQGVGLPSQRSLGRFSVTEGDQ